MSEGHKERSPDLGQEIRALRVSMRCRRGWIDTQKQRIAQSTLRSISALTDRRKRSLRRL